MKEAEGEVWIDSNYAGHFHVDTIVSVPAKSDFSIPAKLDVDTKFLLRYTLGAFKNEDVLVSVTGKARVGKNGIYKNIPLHYEAKYKLADLIK